MISFSIWASMNIDTDIHSINTNFHVPGEGNSEFNFIFKIFVLIV